MSTCGAKSKTTASAPPMATPSPARAPELAAAGPRCRSGSAGRPGSRPPRGCRSRSAGPSARAWRRAPARARPRGATVNSSAGDRGGPEHDPLAAPAAVRRPAGRPPARPWRSVSACRPSPVLVEIRNDRQAPGPQIGGTSSASSRGVGDVDLVQRDQPGPVLQSAVGGELGLDHVQVGQRVAARLEGGAVDHVHQGRAALDVAQEVVTRARGPRWRPRSGPGTSATV